MESISNHEFPWSPSGVLLLELIKRVIDENGGREKMHNIIVAEIRGEGYKEDMRRLDEVFKATIKHRTPYSVASVIAGMSYYDFCRKLVIYKSNHPFPT